MYVMVETWGSNSVKTELDNSGVVIVDFTSNRTPFRICWSSNGCCAFQILTFA